MSGREPLRLDLEHAQGDGEAVLDALADLLVVLLERQELEDRAAEAA